VAASDATKASAQKTNAKLDIRRDVKSNLKEGIEACCKPGISPAMYTMLALKDSARKKINDNATILKVKKGPKNFRVAAAVGRD
jgi:hypothetical protein